MPGVTELLTHFREGRGDGVSKLVTLSAAIEQFVKPGDSIHVAYADARPNAALMEIARQFRGTSPGFELSTAGFVNVQHVLVAEGLLRRLITSFAGENYPAPHASHILQEAVRHGRLKVENWSLWTLVARLIGGALGLPFFPVRSLEGSDMAKEHLGSRYSQLSDPFNSGSPTGVVSSLRPEIVLIHGVAADVHGNVILAAPYGEATWGALAARRGVVATVETIVSTQAIRDAGMLVLPGHLVRAVAEVPFGSHPYGLYANGFPGVENYAQDHDFMVEVQSSSSNAEMLSAWADDVVFGAGGHAGYLKRLGVSRLMGLRGASAPDIWEFELGSADAAHQVTEEECLVVAASRLLANKLTEGRFDAVLAGVGLSNLAAWLATGIAAEQGSHVQLMAEIGMFGYDPRPGDPFIFSARNIPTCTWVTDVFSVLGALVSGPATRCIGVIGAAQVDQLGRVNSTSTADGTFIVGSGGANDVATGAEEVVVTLKHSPRRLVESVPYITSPGHGVRSIVTTGGVLLRDGDRPFVLTRVHRRGNESKDEAVRQVVESTGWALDVAPDVSFEDPPTAKELQMLRSFDPRRTFLG